MAVDHDDRVAVHEIADFLTQAQRMNRRCVGVQQRLRLLVGLLVVTAQSLDPRQFLASVKSVAAFMDELAQDHLRVADDADVDRPVDIGIVGDAKMVLRQLIHEGRDAFHGRKELPWVETLRGYDQKTNEKSQALLNSDATPIHPLRLCKEVRDFMDRDAIIVVDGHEILNFARQSIPIYSPGHSVNAGPNGCMGVAVPFGMVAGRDLGFSRYDKMAEVFGAHGEYVDKPQDIRPALERAAASGKPAVVNVITDPHARSSTVSFSNYRAI